MYIQECMCDTEIERRRERMLVIHIIYLLLLHSVFPESQLLKIWPLTKYDLDFHSLVYAILKHWSMHKCPNDDLKMKDQYLGTISWNLVTAAKIGIILEGFVVYWFSYISYVN